MATFSTPPTDANLLSGILGVISVIEDNTRKAISPKDIRDGFYTLWENSIFKPTSVTASSIKYVGIDQYQLQDINDNYIYPKVYFGKKQILGQYVMSNLLLDNTIDTDKVDFFFHNMKDNTLHGNDTSIAILAGTQSFQLGNGKLAAPILKSTVVTSPLGNYLNLNITNYSQVTDGATSYGGDINIYSDTGYVSINNFLFPKQTDITQSNNGYVLKYRWTAGQAYGYWESAFSQSITEIIYPQGQVTIQGNPIVLDGYRFSDENIVATAIGGILAGETFSNVDVLDVLRRIIYTYVPPRVSTFHTKVSTGERITLVESGTNPNTLRLNWSIFVNSTYSVPINQITSTPVVNGTFFPSGTAPLTKGTYTGQNTLTLLTNQWDVTNTPPYNIINYTFSVKDSNPVGPTQTTSIRLKYVLPYFYGTSQTLATSSTGAANINNLLYTDEFAPTDKLNRILVEPIIGSPTLSNNQSLFITTEGLPGPTPFGQGYIYFGHPSYYPPIREIKDPNNFVITTSFTTYSIKISDPPPSSKWEDKNYVFYISNLTSVENKPIPYQFLFATQS